MTLVNDISINNIINLIEEWNILKYHEIEELKKSILLTSTEYILNNILDIINPDFDKKLINYIYQLHLIQIQHLYDNDTKYIVQFKIKKYINSIKPILYTKVIPPRSYKNSFIRNISYNIEHVRKKINYLQNVIQPIQRSDEWYIFRHNLLTASSAWKVFGSQSIKNQLIYEKCRPYNIYKHPPIDSPLHWGQKYEPISIEFYKKLYKTEITDYGCIKHSKYPFIGASPDGINTDSQNPRYGRMLEIKNIVNRKINGIPKLEYWIQMQLQMETCDLNECDFLETRFIEYDNEDAFYNDGSFTYSHDNKLKGAIILFSDNGIPHYEYAPLYITKNEYDNWVEYILDKNSHCEWVQNQFWKLDEYSNILVLRNKLWFTNAVPYIENIWNIILHERCYGYEHRAPKKRKSIQCKNNLLSKCHINIEKL
uniref:YqaJ viral recombinase domain-containing protein n=1 Tax=viral metagenome TaxID=1070528 RepID=A0A6C0AZB7_9ZZZZ|tara:strand:- start:34372 stop:35646 length:1275 start_codon:yes stop_codon:yes gene_type:complete